MAHEVPSPDLHAVLLHLERCLVDTVVLVLWVYPERVFFVDVRSAHTNKNKHEKTRSGEDAHLMATGYIAMYIMTTYRTLGYMSTWWRGFAENVLGRGSQR